MGVEESIALVLARLAPAAGQVGRLVDVAGEAGKLHDVDVDAPRHGLRQMLQIAARPVAGRDGIGRRSSRALVPLPSCEGASVTPGWPPRDWIRRRSSSGVASGTSAGSTRAWPRRARWHRRCRWRPPH